MTRGMIEGSPDQTFLPPSKAIEFAKDNGLYLTGDYLLDAYWEPFQKSGYLGKFYYRIRCNEHVKQMVGGRLYLYDEWLINPFTKEVIKDREYRDGAFMELDFPRRSQQNGLYGFNRSFYEMEKKDPQIPFVYQELPREIQYRMIAKKDGKYGMISMKNEMMIPFEYDRMSFVRFNLRRFKNEYVLVQQNGLWGMMDTEGNEILPVKYNSMRKKDENTIVGYISETEKVTYNFRTKKTVEK